MSNFLLSQLLVGIAICTDVVSFQLKERHKIVACLMISALMISIHFMLLSHWTAAFLALLGAARFGVSIFSTSKKVMTLFMVTSLAIGIISYQGFLSILGCSGTMFGTAASFCREDKLLRQFMLIGTSFWILHNVLAGSPLAVLMELLFFSSNLIGYFRFYIRPKKRPLHP